VSRLGGCYLPSLSLSFPLPFPISCALFLFVDLLSHSSSRSLSLCSFLPPLFLFCYGYSEGLNPGPIYPEYPSAASYFLFLLSMVPLSFCVYSSDVKMKKENVITYLLINCFFFLSSKPVYQQTLESNNKHRSKYQLLLRLGSMVGLSLAFGPVEKQHIQWRVW
jgi:hypothetical protein